MKPEQPRSTQETDDEFNEWNKVHNENENEKVDAEKEHELNRMRGEEIHRIIESEETKDNKAPNNLANDLSEEDKKVIENLKYEDCRKNADYMCKISIENLQSASKPTNKNEKDRYYEDYDFRKECYRREYDKNSERYLKYRFYENAKSILDQNSSTFRHITMEIGKPLGFEDINITEHMDYKEDHYWDYKWRGNFVGEEVENMDSIGAVAIDFVGMAEELFGRNSKLYGEVCRSMSKLSHDYLGGKLKVKEMQDIQFQTFSGMLDRDSGPTEMLSTDPETVPVFYGRENGDFYKGMHSVNKNPTTPNVAEQPSEGMQGEKTPEDFGFKDW